MEGQMSIYDFPEYLPDDAKKTKCINANNCDAYPVGCGGTIEPCRFGGPFKFEKCMNPPEEE